MSALLDGDSPASATIHAEVQFMDDTSLKVYSARGHSVTIRDADGTLLSTAKVWVTGGAIPLTCNLWVRQP